jgi:hypothetical protein
MINPFETDFIIFLQMGYPDDQEIRVHITPGDDHVRCWKPIRVIIVEFDIYR